MEIEGFATGTGSSDGAMQCPICLNTDFHCAQYSRSHPMTQGIMDASAVDRGNPGRAAVLTTIRNRRDPQTHAALRRP